MLINVDWCTQVPTEPCPQQTSEKTMERKTLAEALEREIFAHSKELCNKKVCSGSWRSSLQFSVQIHCPWMIGLNISICYCLQGLLMWTCAHQMSSSKWSSGWATSTAAWTPSSTPATTASSSLPSSASSNASVISVNVPAGGRTTTVPPTSAPLETRAKAQRITTPAAWTAASVPCPPRPVRAPATWARDSHPAPKGKHYTSGGPPPRLPPHPTCCPAALQTSSREPWEGRWEEGKQARRRLGVFSLSPLGRIETREGSTEIAPCLMIRCDSLRRDSFIPCGLGFNRFPTFTVQDPMITHQSVDCQCH